VNFVCLFEVLVIKV